jgi:hypothetical protein
MLYSKTMRDAVDLSTSPECQRFLAIQYEVITVQCTMRSCLAKGTLFVQSEPAVMLSRAEAAIISKI